jgi:hypothetical protein
LKQKSVVHLKIFKLRALYIASNVALLLRNPTYQKSAKGYLRIARSNALKGQPSKVTFGNSAHLRAFALASA